MGEEVRRVRHDTPFGAGVPLGRWAGVPIRAHWSVLIALVLFAAVIATVDLPASRPGLTGPAYWTAGVLTALTLFVTLLVHELAHAVTARHYHLDVRRITLWMLGGLTELEGEAPTPRADAFIAGAGPLASLVLGAVFAAAAALVPGAGLLATALVWLAGINVLLAVFNLLPGAPLDGGRLLRAWMWWRSRDRALAAERAARAGRVLGMVLIGLGLVEMFAGYAAGAWLALVGWFIFDGAASERYAVRAETLHGRLVRDAMTPTPQVVPDWWTVDRLVSTLTPESLRQPAFPLVDLDGRFTGIVTLQSLDRVPIARRDATMLRDLTARTGRLLQTSPGADLGDLVLAIHLRGGLAIVVDEGHPVGVVSEASIARLVHLSPNREAAGTRRPG